MKRECMKCGSINTMAKGGAMEACPMCGAIYSKVEATQAGAQRPRPVIETKQPAAVASHPPEPPPPPEQSSNEWRPPVGAKKRSAWPWIVGAIVVLYGYGQFLRMSGTHDRRVAVADTPASTAVPKQRDVMDQLPETMLAGYRANEVRQDAEMAGHFIRVSGTVKSVKKSAFGGMIVRYEIPGDREDLVLNAADDQTGNVSALNVGQLSMAVCDHFAFILGGPVGYKCIIVR